MHEHPSSLITDDQEEITEYKLACEKYLKYLHKVITKEINKLSSTRTQLISDHFERHDPLGTYTSTAQKDKEVIRELLIQLFNEDRTKAVAEVKGLSLPYSLQIALEKQAVIQTAQDILKREKPPSEKKIEFFDHLKKERKILTTRRDSGFITFLKALGVVGASILGLPLGGLGVLVTGYYAHNKFFKPRGERFLEEIKDKTPKKNNRR